jgi:hypothetical protein
MLKKKIWPGVGLLAMLLVLGLLLAATRPGALTTAQQAPILDWRFGVIESYESPAAADQLGAAWTRITFHWGEMQPNSAEDWILPVTTAQLQNERESGREVTGLLIGLPGWARDSQGLPAGLYLPPDDPGNLWAAYVRRIIGYYAADVQHWVIWNEPDIWDKETPGHTWDGSEEDFAQLLRVAYLVAKTENPAAIIHLPAFTYFWDANYGREQYMRRLLAVLVADPEAAAHNYYFDVATAHLYFQPDQIYNVLVEFQAIMQEFGLQKPIWLMETNAPPIDDPAWPVESPTLLVTQEEQAAFMPQVIAVALAAGAERIGIFKLIDTETDRVANPEPFGLLRMDGSSRPGFDTYQLASAYLSGVEQATRERWDAIGQIRLDQRDTTTTVIFARLPEPQLVQVPATAQTAVLASMWGEQRQVSAQEGLFEVIVPPARCAQYIGTYCMIGGETFYLIQAKAGKTLPPDLPVRQLSPLPTPIPTLPVANTPVREKPEIEQTTSPTVVFPLLEETVTATNTAQPSPTPTAQPDADLDPVGQTVAPNRPADALPLGYMAIGAAAVLALLLGVVAWRMMRSP